MVRHGLSDSWTEVKFVILGWLCLEVFSTWCYTFILLCFAVMLGILLLTMSRKTWILRFILQKMVSTLFLQWEESTMALYVMCMQRRNRQSTCVFWVWKFTLKSNIELNARTFHVKRLFYVRTYLLFAIEAHDIDGAFINKRRQTLAVRLGLRLKCSSIIKAADMTLLKALKHVPV